MPVKQTAERNQLGKFTPKFAELNDDILFGEGGRFSARHKPRNSSIADGAVTDPLFATYHLQ